MKDLKYEQKRSLSRQEAADQLTALADALREGGEAELELGAGTLSLRIPDDLRSEVEVEIGGGEIELEIEFKWPTASKRAASAGTEAAATAKAAPRKSASTGARRSSGTGTGRTSSRSTKRSATKTA
ncbi:amphi-Trp domain-containing protein [Streptomyces sp. HUAS 31]|uniref:amphi-Trp domain-containing protein n=1 Tax=Streptomyces TaxID=1883 RepID=UPI00230572B0|nr:amphi-Trp domain-containing protein [Streptomyces sp. HUAS 31]WCD99094.1 amphi-Trp domain-containing protein [Streptomyces sp. HUAS 31]